MEMWRRPAGWDSAASESHHKTEIKAPAKNPQRNASSCIEQTAPCQLEKLFQQAYGALDDDHIVDTVITKTNAIAGSKFTVKVDDHGVPTMSWALKKYNLYKPSRLEEVSEAFWGANLYPFYLMKIGVVPLEKSKNLQIHTLNLKAFCCAGTPLRPLYKKILIGVSILSPNFFRCLRFRTPEGWNFLN